MKTLPLIRATAEQLPIVSQNRLGVEVICGSAGSGKTSTALLRLKSLFHMFYSRRKRENNPSPVRALVLTFNRTLAGYVRNLAEDQIEQIEVNLEIETFARWAMSRLDHPSIRQQIASDTLHSLAGRLNELTQDYVLKEVDYLLGRFRPENLEDYISAERTGRGITPRVDRKLRQKILSEVVIPYLEWKEENSILDWNSLAIQMQEEIEPIGYDIVVVDETQDFSANQLRAIGHHLAENHSITFVIDTVQRIYARGFTWSEAGYTVRPERSHILRQNHRNTQEIAAFAAGILYGMSVDRDGALPNLENAQSRGPLPLVLRGLYQNQAQWAINYIKNKINLANDSVVFLKNRGGKWFSEIARQLSQQNIDYADITRCSEWPKGHVNVALSTFYSAKGLEFDYVFILGLNDETAPFEDENLEDKVFVLRRLLAVAIARARKAVFIGYKPGEESRLVSYFKDRTYEEKNV